MLILQGGLVGLAAGVQNALRLLPAAWSPIVDDIIKYSVLLAALGGLYRMIVKPAREHTKALRRLVTTVEREFPESGTSLRATVDRSDLRMAEMFDRFNDMEIYMQRLDGKVLAVDTKVDALDEKLSRHMNDVKDNGESS